MKVRQTARRERHFIISERLAFNKAASRKRKTESVTIGRSTRCESGVPLSNQISAPHDDASATKRVGSVRSCATAYPTIEFSRRSRNWWSWLKGTPPECVHLEDNAGWAATLLPDTLYLQGKRSITRECPRPEVSLCRDCLIQVAEPELIAYPGRLLAFEPDPEVFTQYFFLSVPDFERAGLKPEVAQAIEHRLRQTPETCASCEQAATWLWFSREQVPSLDDVQRIREAPGEWLCARHGSQKLCRAFERIAEANVFYINLPFGESGAYVWI
jgi:hypothetical protein